MKWRVFTFICQSIFFWITASKLACMPFASRLPFKLVTLPPCRRWTAQLKVDRTDSCCGMDTWLVDEVTNANTVSHSNLLDAQNVFSPLPLNREKEFCFLVNVDFTATLEIFYLFRPFMWIDSINELRLRYPKLGYNGGKASSVVGAKIFMSAPSCIWGCIH